MNSNLVSTVPGQRKEAVAATGREAVNLALTHQPDVVVIDYSIPELNGVDATRQIRAALPDTEVLLFTMHDSEDVLQRALTAGARGYLLDDAPIMTIAFDNAEVAPLPVKWQMRRVLVVSSVLGVLAVIQSFGLLYLFDRVMHLDRGMIQTGLLLQLVVGGHLMLLVTRSKGPFWKRRYPAPKLFWAVVATQIFAAFMAVYGWIVPEISWALVADIWGYCLIGMVVIDIVKLGLYHRLDEEETHQSRWLARLKGSVDGLGSLYRKA